MPSSSDAPCGCPVCVFSHSFMKRKNGHPQEVSLLDGESIILGAVKV